MQHYRRRRTSPNVTATASSFEDAAHRSRVRPAFDEPGTGGHETQLADAQAEASKLGVTVESFRASTVTELDNALATIAAKGMNGLLNFQGGLSYINRQRIVDFAAKHRIPAIYQATVFAAAEAS